MAGGSPGAPVAVSSAVRLEALATLDPKTYRPHLIHSSERIWSETNCYVDLWVELIHALGAEPLAASAYCLSADFEGTQWSFFKPPAEDLRRVYGFEVGEMNVWRPLLDHIEETLALGQLLTIEVDAWFLPDTAGVSYQLEHTKTSIVPALVDRSGRVLRYFHGAGYHELRDGDFEGLFAPPLLPPYVELIRLDHLRTGGETQVALAVELARSHLDRRPAVNPVARLGERLSSVSEWLSGQDDPRIFHQLAFGTCRQCGATAEVAASFLEWLGRNAMLDLGQAAADLFEVAEGAKALQFSLARVARGRQIDLASAAAPLADAWARALDTTEAALGR